MTESKIYHDLPDVNSKLLTEFGLTRSEIILIAQEAVAGRTSAVPHEPRTAPGVLAYFAGTKGLRDVSVPKGYVADDTNNIASVVNPKTGIQIIYQNVDSAAISSVEPKAISAKGPASQKMVAHSTLNMFPALEKEDQQKINRQTWYLCVCMNGEDVRVEISKPYSIDNGQFSGFIERIFIVKMGEWTDPESFSSDEAPAQDFDIQVTKKK